MSKDLNYIVDVLMDIDKANQTVITSLEEHSSCDKEKVKEAKELMDKAYKLLLQSLV